MKFWKYAIGASLVVVCLFAFNVHAKKAAEPKDMVVKTIAIGDVDAGYDMSGNKAYEVKETIQIGLKKEIEKRGKGKYNVKITSPAVVAEGTKIDSSKFPTLPTNRAPTQKEMQEYMAQMQGWQKQMTGQVKVHKPVAADAYITVKVQSGKGGASTGGAASTIGSLTGVDTSLGSVSTESTKIYLVCDMRDPATGVLQDRYTAKASSVKFRNLAGYTSYDYGNDSITRERLFNSAIKKCGKWIVKNVD